MEEHLAEEERTGKATTHPPDTLGKYITGRKYKFLMNEIILFHLFIFFFKREFAFSGSQLGVGPACYTA